MIKLKSILLENNGAIDDLLSDCSYFISENRKMLLRKRYIWRSSKNKYDIQKRPFRERKEIRGSSWLYYLYETMKPSNVPSRKELIPCQGYVSSKFFGAAELNSYIVFPIGRRYTFVYARFIKDFNFNVIRKKYTIPDSGLFSRFPSVMMTLGDLKNIAEKNGNVDRKNRIVNLQKKFKLASDKWSLAVNEKNVNKIVPLFDDALEHTEPLLDSEIIQEYEPKLIQTYEQSFEYMNEYLDLLMQYKGIEANMENVEVGMYAPDGFYYVDPSYMGRIREMI